MGSRGRSKKLREREDRAEAAASQPDSAEGEAGEAADDVSADAVNSEDAEGLMEILTPRGVGVVVEARHFCMMMRGVQKQNSSTLSSAMRGIFQEDARTRMEFMDLIRR